MTPPSHTVTDSPVGPLTLVAAGESLSGVYFQVHRRRQRLPEVGARDDHRHLFAVVAAQLEQYFAGERRAFSLPLDPGGDKFQRSVWDQLSEIPYGTTTTYGAIARALGRPGAAQAVGMANGANPISIIVPCHRVIGADGALTGYAGGLERKRFLLELERPPAGEEGRLF